jgi:ABC-type transporter Mla MlaB component
MAEGGRIVTMTVPSPLGRDELPRLFAHTCALLARAPGCELLLCRLDGVAADVVAVDALARLALAARRAHCEVRLRGASPELLGLVELIGLGDVLRCKTPALGREPGVVERHAEQREQRLGGEEESHFDDL